MDLAHGVEQTLHHIAQQDARAEHDTHSLQGLHDSAKDVWGHFEAVWPYEAHKVHHRVLTSETGNTGHARRQRVKTQTYIPPQYSGCKPSFRPLDLNTQSMVCEVEEKSNNDARMSTHGNKWRKEDGLGPVYNGLVKVLLISGQYIVCLPFTLAIMAADMMCFG